MGCPSRRRVVSSVTSLCQYLGRKRFFRTGFATGKPSKIKGLILVRMS